MSDNSSSLYINNLNAKLVQFDNLYNLSIDEFNTKNYYDDYTIKSTLFNNFSERFLFYYLKNIFKKYESNETLNESNDILKGIKEKFVKSEDNNINKDDDDISSQQQTLSVSASVTPSVTPSSTPQKSRRQSTLRSGPSSRGLASPGTQGVFTPELGSPGVFTPELGTPVSVTPATLQSYERQYNEQESTNIGKKFTFVPPSPLRQEESSLGSQSSPHRQKVSSLGKRRYSPSSDEEVIEEDVIEDIQNINDIISLLNTNYKTFKSYVKDDDNKQKFVRLIESIITNIKIEKEKDIKNLEIFLDFDLDILEIIKKKLSNSENTEEGVSDLYRFTIKKKGGVISKKKIIGGENYYNIPDEDFFKKNKIKLKCNNILEFFLICDIIHDIHSIRGKEDSNGYNDYNGIELLDINLENINLNKDIKIFFNDKYKLNDSIDEQKKEIINKIKKTPENICFEILQQLYERDEYYKFYYNYNFNNEDKEEFDELQYNFTYVDIIGQFKKFVKNEEVHTNYEIKLKPSIGTIIDSACYYNIKKLNEKELIYPDEKRLKFEFKLFNDKVIPDVKKIYNELDNYEITLKETIKYNKNGENEFEEYNILNMNNFKSLLKNLGNNKKKNNTK